MATLLLGDCWQIGKAVRPYNVKLHNLFLIFPVLIAVNLTGCSCDCNVAGASSKSDSEHDTFTLMGYNVQNFFNLDGISVFDEYVQDPEKSPHPYSAAKLLTKVSHAADMIRECNGGKRLEILAVEEFENDFTQGPAFDLQKALEVYREKSLDSLLGAEVMDEKLLGYPVGFFLIKRLKELGLSGYHSHQPAYDFTWFDRGNARRSVFLSRFEATGMHQYPVQDAWDLFEVSFDVHRNAFTVINNYWKSGASSPKSEPNHVQNAGVLRKIVEQRLRENSSADIVLVGDFNSHHNQTLRMGNAVELTGINSVLRY